MLTYKSYHKFVLINVYLAIERGVFYLLLG